MKSKSIEKTLLLLSLFITPFLFLSIHSCDDDDKDNKELILTIASEQLIYDGNYMFSPYWAKVDNSDEWRTFDYISDFDYESGYEYTVRVWQEKWHNGEIQDASIYRYKLLEVIAKTKKDTEDMPEQVFFVRIASRKSNDVDNPYYVCCLGPERWNPFPEIEGFEYEEGYEYLVGLKRKFNGSNATPKFSFIHMETYEKGQKEFEGFEY